MWQFLASRSHIVRVCRQVPKLPLHPRRPRKQRAIPKRTIDPLRFSALTAPLSSGCQVLFIAVHIHHRVRSHGIRLSRSEDIHSGRRVSLGKLRRRDLVTILQRRRCSRQSARIDNKRRRPVRKLSCQIFGGITVIPHPHALVTCS